MKRIIFFSLFVLVLANVSHADHVVTSINGPIVMLEQPYSDSYGSDYFYSDMGNQHSKKNELSKYRPVIVEIARYLNIPADVLYAVIKAESNGKVGAVSSKGAIGFMQLMPATAQDMGVNPYNPVENLWGGAKYLAELLARFNGNLRLALAAYNAGPGAVERYGGVPPYTETQIYVEKIIREIKKRD